MPRPGRVRCAPGPRARESAPDSHLGGRPRPRAAAATCSHARRQVVAVRPSAESARSGRASTAPSRPEDSERSPRVAQQARLAGRGAARSSISSRSGPGEGVQKLKSQPSFSRSGTSRSTALEAPVASASCSATRTWRRAVPSGGCCGAKRPRTISPALLFRHPRPSALTGAPISASEQPLEAWPSPATLTRPQASTALPRGGCGCALGDARRVPSGARREAGTGCGYGHGTGRRHRRGRHADGPPQRGGRLAGRRCRRRGGLRGGVAGVGGHARRRPRGDRPGAARAGGRLRGGPGSRGRRGPAEGAPIDRACAVGRRGRCARPGPRPRRRGGRAARARPRALAPGGGARRRESRADRLGPPRRIVVLSVVQLPLYGGLVDAAQGFRLTQAYVPLVLAGIALFPAVGDEERCTRWLLWVFGIVAAYAAFRAAVAPPAWFKNSLGSDGTHDAGKASCATSARSPRS